MNLKERFIEVVEKEFSKKSILVIGDVMVDEYIIGNVRRISPEAPVPVLSYKEKRIEAGGASNVAHNIRALGASAGISGVAAEDESGLWLRKHMTENNIEAEGLLAESGRPTTLKTRFATKSQQLLRMDNEVSYCITDATKEKLYAYLENAVKKYDAVILSDYNKGVFGDEEFVKKIISLCEKNKVFISVDSKSRNISAFAGVDFVKPNNLELEEAVGIKIEDDESLTLAGKTYLKKSGAKSLIVTRGAQGISVFVSEKGGRYDYSSKAVAVYDVTGAGDTVISTVTLGMICGLTICEAVQLANFAASVSISKLGTATLTVQELIDRIYAEKNL